MIPFTWQMKAIAAGILLAIVLGIGAKIYSSGKDAGRGEGSREQLDIDKGSMQQERTQLQATLAANKKRDEQAQSIIAQQQGLIDRATSRISQLAVSRAQDQRAVAALPDSAVFSDVTKKLSIRPATDSTPSFYPAELRQIDSVVTDYSKLSDSNGELAKKQAATEEQLKQLNERVSAIASDRDALITWGNGMVGHYTKAYNAAQKHHSTFVTVLTFGLVRTKRLDLPDPVTLAVPVKK